MHDETTQYRPEKPLFLYDADCGFCVSWIDYFQARVGDAVWFASYQQMASELPEYGVQDLSYAVHLIETDGAVTDGAQATFRMLSYGKKRSWLGWLYERCRPFRAASEWFYQFVARHRDGFYTLTKLCIGVPIRDSEYGVVRNLFLRALGVIYLIAFVSFGIQMSSLIGSGGIVPASQYLNALWSQVGAGAVWRAPTLLWISASDGAIFVLFSVGIVAAVGIMTRIMQRTALVVAFATYLSFVAATQVFMTYQWDTLLLETGVLAIVFSLFLPTIWALRALLFKLVFLSGVGKLIGGDGTWWNLTALNYHFMTQPLPTPLAWYVHQLPLWVHKIMTALALGVEIVVPILFFAPRRIRFVAGWAVIGLEVLIILTGNYTFFNLLTIALALLLFDDRAITRIRPTKLIAYVKDRCADIQTQGVRVALSVLVAVLLVVSIIQGVAGTLPPGMQNLHAFVRPFYISNTYGLFIDMTTTRPEIIIQGSHDGETWQTYDFAYKPDRLGQAPPIVAPHQPRVDWQMWFAALNGDMRSSPWLQRFIIKLFQNDTAVTTLLDRNPFRLSPPQHIRAVMYEYSFTDDWGSEKWWTRKRVGMYLPPVSRSQITQ